MKKKVGIYLVLVSLFTALLFLIPLLNPINAEVKEGDTLAKLRGQLQELKNKKTAQENAKKQTQAEITANHNKIKTAEYEIDNARKEIEELNNEIDKSNAEIAKVKDETEDLLRLYQELQSENVYMSYITGASSMTDMIMRIDAINQVADFNKQKLNELELLSDTNSKLTNELKKYQDKLNDNIAIYEENIDKLGDEYAKLEEGAVTIDEEIKAMSELIKYYENFGCKEDEDLIACVRALKNNEGWLKPVTSAKVTSEVGYRNKPTASASSNHKGIDMAVPEGTPVYPTANGQVAAIIRRSSCGGNMLYIWTIVQGKKYTYVFMHLKDIYVSVGDEVTVDKPVAASGGGASTMSYDKCTTGAHLHYGLSEGHHFGAVGDLPLSKFNAYIINPPGYPKKGGRFTSRA